MKRGTVLQNAIFYMFGIYTTLVTKGNCGNITNADLCDPKHLCSDFGEGIKVNDPQNCHNYFLCVENEKKEVIPTLNLCPENKHFDFESQDCLVDNEGEYCTNSCLLRESSTLVEFEGGVDVCSPSTSCSNLGLGDKVPDPDNCTNYFLCIQNKAGGILPSDGPLSCEKGYFDVELLECIDEGDECDRPCLNFNCTFECNLDIEDPYLISDPHNCSIYTVCTPGSHTIVESCPLEKPYFDGKECSDNKYTCCDSCEPYCEVPFVQTLDPEDCTSYYLCEEVGIPKDENRYSCPSNQYFEPSRRLCIDAEGTTCESRC